MNRVLACLALSAAPLAAQPAEPFERAVLPFITKYCVSCHNGKSNSGGLDLTDYPTAKAFRESRETWERILKRVSAGTMPPRRMPPPPPEETEAVVAWLRNQLNVRE